MLLMVVVTGVIVSVYCAVDLSLMCCVAESDMCFVPIMAEHDKGCAGVANEGKVVLLSSGKSCPFECHLFSRWYGCNPSLLFSFDSHDDTGGVDEVSKGKFAVHSSSGEAGFLEHREKSMIWGGCTVDRTTFSVLLMEEDGGKVGVDADSEGKSVVLFNSGKASSLKENKV